MLQLQKRRQNVALMTAVLSSSVNVDAVDYVSSHTPFESTFLLLIRRTSFVLTLLASCEVRRGIQHFTTSARERVRVWCLCCWRRTPTSTFATVYVPAPSRPQTPPAGFDLLFFPPQDGETPLDIATRLKFKKIVNMLKKAQ